MGAKDRSKPRRAAVTTVPVNGHSATVSVFVRPDLWIALLLALGTFVLYVPSLSNGFVEYDDPQYVTENPMVQKGLTLQGIGWAFTTTHFGNWLPVTWLSHMLDVQLWGLRAGGHHATTVLLHAVNAAMLFLFVNKATGARWRALAIGAVWAAHPLRVESVTWIAERKDVLAATFFLLMLLAYLRYCRGPTIGRYLVIALCLALGLMSKTMIVTAPFVLLLLDYWPLRRFRFSPEATGKTETAFPMTSRAAGRLILEKIPLLVLALIASAWTSSLQGMAMTALRGLTLGQRVANAIVAVPRYLGKTMRPIDLVALYPHPGSWPLWEVAASAVLVAALCTVAIFSVRRRPWLFVGWFWFLGMLVPVLGFVQVGAQSIADRYMYLPHIGLFVAVAWGIDEWVRRVPKLKPAIAPTIVAIVIVFGAGSWLQQGYWFSTLDLFEHALLVDERNWVAHNFVGQVREAQGDAQGAIEHYERSIALFPNHPDARFHYGVALNSIGRSDEAIEQLRKSAELSPHWSPPLLWMSTFFMQRKEYDRAFQAIDDAQRIDPGNPDIRAQRGGLLLEVGRRQEAAQAFREALQIDPTHEGAMRGLKALDEPHAAGH